MDEILLLTMEGAGQAGDDLLIFPALPADHYSLSEIERIKVVTPDQLVIEKDAEFSIPFDTADRVYILLLPNTQKDEIPVGSQIWIKRSLGQITPPQ
jgi:hypothetical protein